MSDAPERIGLVSDGMGRWALWNREDWPFADALPYIRADLFDAQARRIEELEAALQWIGRRLGGVPPEAAMDPNYIAADQVRQVCHDITACARASLSKGTEGE